jgi:hypothetical protein
MKSYLVTKQHYKKNVTRSPLVPFFSSDSFLQPHDFERAAEVSATQGISNKEPWF